MSKHAKVNYEYTIQNDISKGDARSWKKVLKLSISNFLILNPNFQIFFN